MGKKGAIDTPKTKVISYIDGYNLYFGIREKSRVRDSAGTEVNKHWMKYMWLDVVKLSETLLRPGQVLIQTKYFSARVRGKPDSEVRQSLFIDAIRTLPNIKLYWGLFQPDKRECGKCGGHSFFPQEKKTDVNIATQMINDAIHHNFDVAYLISGDSDQVPTIEMARGLFKKRVIVAFPPKRESADLQAVATAVYRIGEAKLKACILPHKITLPSGKEIECPSKWR